MTESSEESGSLCGISISLSDCSIPESGCTSSTASCIESSEIPFEDCLKPRKCDRATFLGENGGNSSRSRKYGINIKTCLYCVVITIICMSLFLFGLCAGLIGGILFFSKNGSIKESWRPDGNESQRNSNLDRDIVALVVNSTLAGTLRTHIGVNELNLKNEDPGMSFYPISTEENIVFDCSYECTRVNAGAVIGRLPFPIIVGLTLLFAFAKHMELAKGISREWIDKNENCVDDSLAVYCDIDEREAWLCEGNCLHRPLGILVKDTLYCVEVVSTTSIEETQAAAFWKFWEECVEFREGELMEEKEEDVFCHKYYVALNPKDYCSE